MSDPFSFPGYSRFESVPTRTHDFESGRLDYDGKRLVIQLVRPLLKPGLDWVVKAVFDCDQRVWKYDQNLMVGFARLADTDIGPAIAFVAGQGEEKKVVRFTPFLELFGQSTSIEKRAAAKQQAAKFLNVGVMLHQVEHVALERLKESRQAEERAAKEKRYQVKQAAKEERINAILGRLNVTAYTRDGRQLYGLPVVEKEWESLQSGTKVILVDSIDGDQVGTPIEAFTVWKTPGGNPKQINLVPVSSEVRRTEVTAEKRIVPQPIGKVQIKRDGQILGVRLYQSIDDIRAARGDGLNGGIYVAVKPAVPGKIEVLSVHHDRVDTIGKFEALSL